MLSIGKLASGTTGRSVDYYINTVADGVEDYYTGAGEAPGEWMGAGAELLGLVGQVDGDDLRAVMAGLDPATGQDLLRGNSGRRSVPGFDLTFSSPKSISLLYAFGDERVRGQVIAAHDEAVRATLANYLEPHAILTRRGAGGAEVMATSGAVAAGFRHRTSRAGDPMLHTHVLVANVVRGVDGRWSTLHGAALYINAKPGAYVYRAHLRHELTARLGLQWGPLRNGIAEVAGISRAVVLAFSRRAQEIAAELQARGESGARAAQVATLATRKRKDYAVDGVSLQAEWDAHGAEVGFGRSDVMALVDREPPTPLTARQRAALYDELGAPEGITREASTFARRDVVMALATRLPHGATAADLEQMAERFLASPRVVPVVEPTIARVTGNALRVEPGRAGDKARQARVVMPLRDEIRYSTPEMLGTERRLVDYARRARSSGVGKVGADALATALARRPYLNDEQRAMVAAVTTSGAGVEVVSAGAGAGKTTSLDAAREAWQASGYRVVGAAAAARAADELRVGAGIDSYTVDRLLLDLAEPSSGGFAPNTVLVVDEAAALGTRRAAALLRFAEVGGAKVVMVGDPHQLQPVDAGGLFRGLTRRLGAHELNENMRQRQLWEREATAELRDGDVVKAMSAYSQHGRVIVADTAAGAIERLVDDWWQAGAAGRLVVMLGQRNVDVDELNRKARARMASAGRLSGPVLHVNDRPFQVGDLAMATRNDYRLGVINGKTRGEVVALDADARTMTLRAENGSVVTFDREYLDGGHAVHGYASTTHKAQGRTVDAAFFFGDEATYREMGYTAMTRGRDDNRFYLSAGDSRVGDGLDLVAEDKDPVHAITRSLQRSAAKELAIDHGGETGFADHTLSQLYAEHDALRDRLRAAPADPAAELARVGEVRRRAEANLAHAEHQVDQLGTRRRGRGERAAAQQTVADWRLRVTEARAQETALGKQGRARVAFLERHGPTLARYDLVTRGIAAREARHIDRVTAAQPDYLISTIGPRPEGRAERVAWRDATSVVERHRLRFGITDPDRALGPQPRSGPAWAAHVSAAGQLHKATEELARRRVAEVARAGPRSAQPAGIERTRTLRRAR